MKKEMEEIDEDMITWDRTSELYPTSQPISQPVSHWGTNKVKR